MERIVRHELTPVYVCVPWVSLAQGSSSSTPHPQPVCLPQEAPELDRLPAGGVLNPAELNGGKLQ